MVAAATALCLDSTNVHRQSTTKKSAAFVSLAGAVVDSQKMALNFGVTGQLLKSSSPANGAEKPSMDTLIVATNNHLRQISPGTAALRKINEVLALSSATPSPSTPLQQQQSSDENSPGTNEALIQAAEQYKEQLMKTIDSNDFVEVERLIDEIEAANLSKSALEISRIGGVVNALRRSIASTHPELARKCRSMIKLWRSNVEALAASSRPSSSCGSSSGTPALVSPAVRRGITPRGKTITPTSQLAYEGYTANPSYAPSDPNKRISPQMAPLKRKASVVSPNATSAREPAKKAKVSPIAAPSQPISVIEARRNVQSTEQLVAALGMEKFLSVSAEKKVETVQVNGAVKVEPISIPSINNQSAEKRGRKKKESKVDGQSSAPVVPRLKIRFGGKSAEEHDVGVNAKTAQQPNALPEATLSTSTAPTAPKVAANKKIVKKPKDTKPAFSWYDSLPTIEELELRSKNPPKVVAKQDTDPAASNTVKFRGRTIFLMPYLGETESGFFPNDKAPKRSF